MFCLFFVRVYVQPLVAVWFSARAKVQSSGGLGECQAQDLKNEASQWNVFANAFMCVCEREIWWVCVHVCVCKTWYGKVKTTFLRVQRVSSLLLTFCQKHQVGLPGDEQTFLEEHRARQREGQRGSHRKRKQRAREREMSKRLPE